MAAAKRQAQAFDAEGRVIPEQELPATLAEGRAFVGADEDVHMHDFEGQPIVVKGKDVAQAFSAGASLTPQAALDEESAQAQRAERMTPGESVKAAVEGNLRGMTFGLSDPALTSLLGPDYAKAARERREAHGPLAAPLELSGTLGTSIGIGAVAPASTLPRLAALGAAEGAAYDVGMEMSRAALEQRELTADKLLAAAGHGALLGGGTALGLGAAGSALSRAGRSALRGMGEGASLSESLDAFANRSTVKSFGQRLYNDLSDNGTNPARIERVGAKLREREIPIGEIGVATKAVREQLEDATSRLQSTARELAAAQAVVQKPLLLNTIERHAAELRRTPLEEYRVAAAQLERRANSINQLEGDEMLFSEALPHAQKLGALAKRAIDRGAAPADALRAAAREVDDILSASADATPLGPVWRAAIEDHQDFSAVSRALHDVAARGEKNHWAKPSDYTAGGLGLLTALASGGNTLASFAAGAATGAGHRLLRDKGPAMVAKIANVLTKIDRRIANGVSAAIEGVKVKRAAPVAVTATARAATYNARREQLDKKLEQIRAIRANPKESAQRLGDATADVAEWNPELAEALQQRILRGAAFLEARLPVILQRANLSPLAVKPRIPPLELRRTLEYVEALEDPLSVLEDLANGHLPRRKIEALREVHPELYSDLRMRILNELTEREKPIPYNRRIMLSLTFDLMGDASLEPGYLGRIQRSFAPPEEQEPGKPAADIDAESVVNNLETQTQRLESGSPLP